MHDYKSIYTKYWDEQMDAAGNLIGVSFETNEVIRKILLQNAQGRILDIGCGVGALVRKGIETGLDIVGVDVADNIVGCASKFAPERFFTGNALCLPFENETFEMVVSTGCLECIAEEDISQVIDEIYRVVKRYVYLIISTVKEDPAEYRLCVHDRGWWETQFFHHGFRKGSNFFDIVDFNYDDKNSNKVELVLEKVPLEAHKRFPLQMLEVELDSYKDMSRMTGARSDAYLMRYYAASKFIREHDRVLDVGCGCGYGTQLLADHSMGREFIGIDNSEWAISYARANYTHSKVRFELGEIPHCLKAYGTGTIDCVTSFKTLKHLQPSELFLTEIHRILIPGGRLILSVPNCWADEGAGTSSSQNCRIYTLNQLRKELSEYFSIEKIFATTANQYKDNALDKFVSAQRNFTEVDVHANDVQSEWILAVAMKKPIPDVSISFIDTVVGDRGSGSHPVLDMVQQYKNPWLKYAMEHFGYRMQNAEILRAWASEVVQDKDFGYADYPAALCVLGYQILGKQAEYKEIENIIVLADEWLHKNRLQSAYETRWRISLCSLTGKLYQKVGKLVDALEIYKCIASWDWHPFSVHIANKITEAAFWAGVLSYRLNDLEGARRFWQQGMEKARLLLETSEEDIFILKHNPNMFNYGDGVREYELAWDFIARCANGIHLLNLRGVHFAGMDEPLLQGSFMQEIRAREMSIRSMIPDFKEDTTLIPLRPDLGTMIAKDWIFPFRAVPKNSTILLYGAGDVGQTYYEQLLCTGYAVAIYWVDKQADKYCHRLPVRFLDAVPINDVDYAVIAISREVTARTISRDLVDRGIPFEKIIWRDKVKPPKVS